MKISYPEKYQEFISQYGEDDGIKYYKKFLRCFSLEKCILKYGKEQGEKIYLLKLNNIKHSGVTLEKCILKYGEEQGKLKFANWKNNCKNDLSSFIHRYGDIKGKEKFKEFQEKCKVKDYIKTDPNSKYNNRLFSTTLEYWVKKCNGNFDEAKIKLHERQNLSSLIKFQKKYGEKIGLEKYLECNKKKINTLSNFIYRYGDIEGQIRWKKYINYLSYIQTKEYFINKYGEIDGMLLYKTHNKKKINNLETYINKYGEDGVKKYEEYLIKRLKFNGYSKIGLEFCQMLNDAIKDDFNMIFFGDNEYHFFTNTSKFKIISPDFYIKDINLVVEFYGNYWHKDNSIRDSERIQLIKDKYGCEVIIIWEKDFVKNKIKTIINLKEKICKKS